MEQNNKTQQSGPVKDLISNTTARTMTFACVKGRWQDLIVTTQRDGEPVEQYADVSAVHRPAVQLSTGTTPSDSPTAVAYIRDWHKSIEVGIGSDEARRDWTEMKLSGWSESKKRVRFEWTGEKYAMRRLWSKEIGLEGWKRRWWRHFAVHAEEPDGSERLVAAWVVEEVKMGKVKKGRLVFG